ncbi:recombination mediator RecR [Paralimibaculum aggregatum]|uniref:recombination mediator RecR n=1 Tax=Paralimibaculum aggregatum TaxID=3036245 RepID=UPI003DA055DD
MPPAPGGTGSGGDELETLIELMARLPGFGPRSARRAALAMVKKRERLLLPLSQALAVVAQSVRNCATCGNVATAEECPICVDPRRDRRLLCVVAEVADLWALERGGAFRGRYHVLGGLLSALDGVTPESLRMPQLAARVAADEVTEVILALPATIDGQTTAHVAAEHLAPTGVQVSQLARGVPVGGDLDYLDDGTLAAALAARQAL